MQYTRSTNGMNLLYKVSFIPSAVTNAVNCRELLRIKKLQISILNFKEVWKQLSQSNLYSTSTFLLPKNRPSTIPAFSHRQTWGQISSVLSDDKHSNLLAHKSPYIPLIYSKTFCLLLSRTTSKFSKKNNFVLPQ